MHFCVFSGSLHTILRNFQFMPGPAARSIQHFISNECPGRASNEFDEIYKTYVVKLRATFHNLQTQLSQLQKLHQVNPDL